ncbi:hypothetical protein [Sediminitomix flava]|uniref:Uncharacterized protein n=1 Tax=Sediminitomix flava TaxID=379075 RepID=A0A315ZH28_SEDFL|nr:hypothetical protein [Sediminitomix flava]PWJ44886.1 hypothetical protein BC781_1011275 [Sediminitomix flava]
MIFISIDQPIKKAHINPNSRYNQQLKKALKQAEEVIELDEQEKLVNLKKTFGIS